MWMTPTTNIHVIYDADLLLDEIIQTVTWSGDIQSAYRTLNVSLNNTIDGKTRAHDFELGRELVFYANDVELFRGFIFRTSIAHDGSMTLTAYDENVYLVKNTESRRFTNATATQIIATLCNDFQITYGDLIDTEYRIPKLILRDMTLWNMMITALTYTERMTGRRFHIFAKEGALQLVERKAQLCEWALESSTNIDSASYSISIEELRNQVKVISENDDVTYQAVRSDPESIARYGIMQHLEYVSEESTQASVDQLAAQRLADMNVLDDDATIAAQGYTDAISGACVYVYEEITGIMGGYYINVDSHTFSQGDHRMNLTLSATDDIPQLEYTPPPEKEAASTNGRRGRR